jgi:3-oxoacyl-[acyl-carrier protein] reductase
MIDPGAKVLAGQTAVITGAGKNIGQRIAEHLAAVGANIVVNGRFDQAAVDETAAMLEQTYGIQALPFLADVTDRAAVDAMVEATMEKFGRIDIAVSNAAHRKQTPFLDMPFDEWKGVISVALDGAFNVCQSCAKHMVANGEGGAIVTLSGISNRVGTLNRIHVNAAKAGLEGFTRGLAREMAPHGINVNAVAPGMIDTTRGASAGARPGMNDRGIPLNRMGTVDEIAGMVRLLCTPEGAYTTGQTIHINGGVYLT